MSNIPKNLRIKCIGFSVTGYGKPAYHDVLQNKYDENGYLAEIDHSNLGGLSIDALPYMLDKFAPKDSVDLVVLELATSWFSLLRKKEEAYLYLSLIINYFMEKNIDIIFLNLYRRDLEDQDCVVSVIKELSIKKSSILDLKKHFRDKLSSDGDDQTIDGVHPTQEAIEYIGNELYEHLIKYFSKLSDDDSSVKYAGLKKLGNPSINFPSTYNNKYSFDNRHGANLFAEKLYQGEEMIINLDKSQIITGIFFLYGPDTNTATLEINGKLYKVAMRDEMSFYRRVGYKYLGSIETESILLRHSVDEELKVVFKKAPWEKVSSLCNYIIGISTIDGLSI